MADVNVTLPQNLAGLVAIAELYSDQVELAMKLDMQCLVGSIGRRLDELSNRGVYQLSLIDLAIKHAPDDPDTRALLEALREMSLADGQQLGDVCGEIVACLCATMGHSAARDGKFDKIKVA